MEVRHSPPSWPKWQQRSASALHTLLNAFFPRPCWLCSASANALLCSHCEHSLPFNNGYRCGHCDLPLEVDTSHCSECMSKPPSYTKAVCAFQYGFPIDLLMRQLKRNRKHVVAEELAKHFVKHLRHQEAHMPDVICPLPIHWRRRLIRGFNQSELIAQSISKQLAIPTNRALRKTHATNDQKSLSRTKRLRNLSNSFQISGDVKDKFVVLIDDVITTGTSVESAARTLLKAGASRVDVWAIARTPKS